MKQLDAIQKQKIVEANAEWDSIGSASAAPMTAAIAAVPALQSSANAFTIKNEIQNVPFYLWKWGCSPTSAAMILGYWRDQGLTQLPSDTNPPTWGDPLNYQLAGDMLTQYDPSGLSAPIIPSPPCGGTLPILIAPGINTEFYQHGIGTWTARNTFFDTYDSFVNEIDSGYPLELTMYPGGSSTDRTTDYGYHSVAVVGYDKSGQLLTLHDTWEGTGTHDIVYGNWFAEQGTTVNPDIIHTITASAGSNGAINPLGSITVPDGIRKTFTITPNSGYVIDAILVDGNPTTQNPYTFNDVTSDHTISATFKPISTSTGWDWSTQGWGDWQHTATWSGGSGSEYGPVMVNDAEGNHGEYGTDVSLSAGSTQSSVSKTFTDPTGTGWNTITFKGLMTPSDVPGGRWMTITVNGIQVFGGTASQSPPGNGVPFEITSSLHNHRQQQ